MGRSLEMKIADLEDKILVDIEEIKTCSEIYGVEGINFGQVMSLERSLIDIKHLKLELERRKVSI